MRLFTILNFFWIFEKVNFTDNKVLEGQNDRYFLSDKRGVFVQNLKNSEILWKKFRALQI